MKNHLTSKELDKLKKSKQDKLVHGSIIKKGDYVRDSKVRQ